MAPASGSCRRQGKARHQRGIGLVGSVPQLALRRQSQCLRHRVGLFEGWVEARNFFFRLVDKFTNFYKIPG